MIEAEGAWIYDKKRGKNAEREADGRRPNQGGDFNAADVTKGHTSNLYSGDGGMLGQLIGRWGNNGRPFVIGKALPMTYADPLPELRKRRPRRGAWTLPAR